LTLAAARRLERQVLPKVLFAMNTYYFDHHSGDNITIDDNGLDLASKSQARRLALKFLGQTIQDGAVANAAWFSKVEVRDRSGLVLRISTSVIVDDL
jgi:hypothetical protein